MIMITIRNYPLVLTLLVLLVFSSCKEERNMYTSRDGKFSIAFSLAPTEAKENVATAYGDIEVNMFLSEVKNDEVELVGYSDYPEELIRQSDIGTLISNAREGVTSNLDAKAEDLKEIDVEGHKGSQFRASGKGFHVVYQLFFVDNRLYQIGLMREKRAISDADFQNFAGTFDLLE